MKIQPPYLLFIADATEPLSIKIANSIAHWRPDLALGEHATIGCTVTTTLPNLSIEDAIAKGAKTFILGFANSGGVVDEAWIPSILQAIEGGMDIASGMHQRLDSFDSIRVHAEKFAVRLIDVRHPSGDFNTGTGYKRTGKRLLTVGTDCSSGKMFTALSIEKEMHLRKMEVQFKATGQCGIFIEGSGIAIDCVVADFIAGAVEQLSPDNQADHWDIIEGQGSLSHPAFAGVSLGLLHGAQPDALVLCHVENRDSMRALSNRPLPDLQQTFSLNLTAARLTNPQAKFVGISLNTSSLSEAAALDKCCQYEAEFNLPTVDPLRRLGGRGIEIIVDTIV